MLAYKLGRSAAARELAVSHTGALAGEDDIAGMFLAECGIARVDTLEGLIEGFPLLARVPAPRAARGGRRVAVVTTTAGGATMVVDPLATRGIAVEPPTPQTLARIKAATGVDVTPARIIDLTLAGAQYKVMKGALDVLTTAPEFDLVVVVVGSSARFYPELAVKPIIDSAGAGKADRGVSGARGAGRAGAARRRRRAEFPHAGGLRRRRRGGAAAARAAADRGAARTSGRHAARMLDELEAYALLERIGVPHAPSVALDAGIKQAPALPFPYPVVVKALSAKIAHKSDVGGVVLECPRRRRRCSRPSRKSAQADQGRSRAGAADDRRASARC